MFLVGYYISLVQAEPGTIWMILVSSVFVLFFLFWAKLLFAKPLWEWGCLPIAFALIVSAVLVYSQILSPYTIAAWIVAAYFLSEVVIEDYITQDLP